MGSCGSFTTAFSDSPYSEAATRGVGSVAESDTLASRRDFAATAMSYTAALPAPALRGHISRYWMLRGTFAREEAMTLLPDGGVHVVLNLGERVRSERYGDVMDGEGAHLVGPMLRSDRQSLLGEHHIVGVTFSPGAFSCFHDWDPMTCATNRVQGFEGAFSAGVARGFTDIAELARYLDSFYLDRFAPARASLVTVIADIEGRGGRLRIDELLRRHAITGRSLERQFARVVGMTPKEFVDLTRFKHALATMERARGRRTLTGIAHACGYYDGAHLANAFTRFTGRPPSRFVLSDLSKSASAGLDIVGS